jgi:glucose/arabinose dehydrogenase
VPFEGERPAGNPVDLLTGFVNEHGEALGRPVGVAVDRQVRFSSPTTSATGSGG